MPLKRTAQQREPHPHGEQEEVEQGAKQPKLEPVDEELMEPGRPHQAFVENEARKYWQDIMQVGSLTKPTREEIRTAAMPILCQAQRRKTGWSPWTMALNAVDAMQLHARERGWIKPPYSRVGESPGYIDALIQLANDADWLAREILLPEHPEPEHPPIYYTVDVRTKMYVPRADSLIRADYVYTRAGGRITKADYINPWPVGRNLILNRSTVLSLGWDACYTLYLDQHKTWHLLLLWTEPTRLVHDIPVLHRCYAEDMIFSPPTSCIIARPEEGSDT